MDTNGQLIRALSRLVTACEMEQEGIDDGKQGLMRAVAQGRAVLQEVVQGAEPATKPAFSFYEYNPRRAARGAEAVRMRVLNPDGSDELLWMTERDVRRNMMAFGPCPELDKALAAYRRLASPAAAEV